MTHGVPSQMRSRFARFSPFASLVLLVAVGACSSVIGIEDLHEGPAPGGGGNNALGGTTGLGGDFVGSNGGASTAAGGSAGKGPGGGSGGAGATGATTTGGSAGDGPIGDGGAGPAGTSVHGHVIDYWGRKLAGVPVEIGGTTVTTDELGGFVIDDVATQYDASLVVQFPDNYDGQIFGWVYQGLTRRDPTLQVYAGLKLQTGDVDITVANSAATLTGTRTMSVALGGTDGSDEYTEVSAPGTIPSAYWRGTGTTQETTHGLVWQANTTTSVPMGYYAYDSKLVALDGLTSTPSPVTLDMSADAIPSGNIAGSVTAGGADPRNNGVFLQFTSNAVMTLFNDTGANNFSYLVPTIANSSLIFAASEGSGPELNAFGGAFALVHKDTLAAGTAGITATIPKPASLLTVTPASDKTKVAASTQFSFQPGAGSAGLYVVAFRQPDTSALRNDALFVVTTKKTFTLPKVVNDSFALVPGHPYVWRVETHGSVANADAAAGPTGFLDEFSGDSDGLVPSGPRRGDGSYTISDYSDPITMAP